MDHVRYEKHEKDEVDLIEYWRIILKRKWVLITFTAALVLFTGIFSFLATPKYESTVTLLIEGEPSKILSIEDEFGYSRSLEDLRSFNTSLKLLKSKSLAERVARKMNLISRPEFGAGRKQKKSLLTAAREALSLKWLIPRKKSETDESMTQVLSNPYSEIAETIRNEIDVSAVRTTKLVEVSYSSSSPVLAAGIVNTLAEEFIDFSIEKRYETTQQASDFLSEQIANLREELATKERELQRYGREKEIYFLTDTESTVVSKFADLNAAFTQAQIERIKKESAYRELKNLDVDSFPQFVNNPLIQILQTEYTRMKNEHEEKSKIFKSSYPEMIKLAAKLESMREELKSEIRKAVEMAESEYRSELKKESSLRDLLEKQRAEVVTMNSNAILYNSLKIEVENKRKLLNSLVERQNETLISARLGGLNTSNISIIDKGEVPPDPVSPKKKRNLILAFLIGILGGGGLCFILEYLDNTVKGPEDVEKLTGLPSLGVIPYLTPDGIKRRKRYGLYSKYKYSERKENPGEEKNLPDIKEIEFVNELYPKLPVSEDYRTVRTSILLSHADAPPKAIAFSSSMPQEGKTATVTNMAVSFSQLDKKVLIIDADLRKPRLHRLFKVKNTGGLSAYLTGRTPVEGAVLKTSIKNVSLVPSGPIPPNPAELLNSERMKKFLNDMKKKYDIILLDTPPILAVVDALIVSTLSDCMVFIIKAGKTMRMPFLRAVEELKQTKTKIIGVLFNEVKLKEREYYSPYYHYYRQGYQYYREEEGEDDLR
ncbi:MAG: polysaccharide biosynthesis tyrosine autokinase [Candidatus Aminicenantes bacterium]|nr:polysaccharide biosynthesis tyrosine autokinase [Candidatus Aminicenantes bacterium]